jgi:hypothetical protein
MISSMLARRARRASLTISLSGDRRYSSEALALAGGLRAPASRSSMVSL